MVSLREPITTRSKDIVFLLGAGASAEAGIPTSAAMIDRIEFLLKDDGNWKPFALLYNHVKSAIYYAAGLRGEFGSGYNYNIEVLVNTLYELERNEEHPLYPFIAAWNSRFVALAQSDFSKVREFRRLILQALKRWMCPDDPSLGDYYAGLAILQKDLNFPLPVFSLNYDLCIERLMTLDRDVRVETGFAGSGSKYVWDWERFEDTSPSPLAQVILYKLHGSINWKRDETTKQLFSVEQVENVDPDHMEVIFGRDFKLDAADPYLFYAYEFRRYTLRAKLIVVLGYGFGDAHINKMLTQGIRSDHNCHVLVVSKCLDGYKEKRAEEIGKLLDLGSTEGSQVTVRPGTAKEFLESAELATQLMAEIRAENDLPF